MNTIEESYDVAIVGAGIVGCTTAYALATRAMKVALLDTGSIGCGTSSSSFGWINATSKSGDRKYFELNAAGLGMYQALAEEWGPENIGLHQTGMIEWAHPGDPLKRQELRTIADRLSSWGYPIQWLDHAQLMQAEPDLRFETDAEGYLAGDDCWLDVPLYLRFLSGRLAEAGVDVFENCRALELNATEEGKVLGVNTQQGNIACDNVIIATGPQTPEVLSELTGYEGFSSRFPMQRGPGLLVTTPAGVGVGINHVAYTSHGSGFHLLDAGNGQLLLGADDTDGLVSEQNGEKALRQATDTLLKRAGQFIPGLQGKDLLDRCHASIGIRAVPADGQSIAGPALSAEGLHIMVTHSGITLAPVLAKLIAESIVSDHIPDQLRPFLIDRFDGVD